MGWENRSEHGYQMFRKTLPVSHVNMISRAVVGLRSYKRTTGTSSRSKPNAIKESKKPTFGLRTSHFTVEKDEVVALVCAMHKSVQLASQDTRRGPIAVEAQYLHDEAALVVYTDFQTQRRAEFSSSKPSRSVSFAIDFPKKVCMIWRARLFLGLSSGSLYDALVARCSPAPEPPSQ